MEHFCRKVCGFYLLDYRWVFIYASGLVFAYDMHIGKIILNNTLNWKKRYFIYPNTNPYFHIYAQKGLCFVVGVVGGYWYRGSAGYLPVILDFLSSKYLLFLQSTIFSTKTQTPRPLITPIHPSYYPPGFSGTYTDCRRLSIFYNQVSKERTLSLIT